MLSASTPHRCQDGRYTHEAFFYAGAAEFMAGTLPFIRAAADARRADPRRARHREDRRAARRAGRHARHGDVRRHGRGRRQPGPHHPGLAGLRRSPCPTGPPLRGIGEPIWAERSAAELVECERHEALLNVCFARSATSSCSAPTTPRACPPRSSPRPAATIPSSPAAARPRPATPTRAPTSSRALRPAAAGRARRRAQSLWFDAAGCAGSARSPSRHARQALADADAIADVVLVVHELAANSIRHGGGEGTLSIWRSDDGVVCEIRDSGRIEDPLAGRVRPAARPRTAAACGWPTSSATSCRSGPTTAAPPSASTSTAERDAGRRFA